ncbi:response regulator [Vibrio penaeicida]|uniref:response regulator n=1 Tax=Vibrio penaeicida TaxID=104609 RepID=UPI000CEA5066|nr:response regulator [Vibrio penaeicida]
MNTIQNKKILLVDDCELIRNTSRIMILNIGFLAENIFMCSSANRALSLCKAHIFDVIIIDQNLGNGASGLELLQALHLQELRAHDTIVIVATADNSMNVVQGFSSYNPNAYIIKPLRMDTLSSSIQSNLNLQKLSKNAIHAYQEAGLNGFMTALKSTSSPKKAMYVIEQFAHFNQAPQEHRLIVLQAFFKSHPTTKLGLIYAFLLLQNGKISQSESILHTLVQRTDCRPVDYYPLKLALLTAKGDLSASKELTNSILSERNDDPSAISSLLWTSFIVPDLLCSDLLHRLRQHLSKNLWIDDEHKLLLCAQLAKNGCSNPKATWNSIPLPTNNRFSNTYEMLFTAWCECKLGNNISHPINTLISSPLFEHSSLANLFLLDVLEQSVNDTELNKVYDRINHIGEKILCFLKRSVVTRATAKQSKTQQSIQLA